MTINHQHIGNHNDTSFGDFKQNTYPEIYISVVKTVIAFAIQAVPANSCSWAALQTCELQSRRLRKFCEFTCRVEH